MLIENTPGLTLPDTAEKAAVLVVDDEYGPRESIAFSLAGDFAVETADRAKEALAKIRNRVPAPI